jgi:hypothetical protein
VNSTTEQNPSKPSFRFVIAATFTAEPLRSVIALWGAELQSNFEVTFAPYNQVLQTVLHPMSEFGRNEHGINVVLARLKDLADFDPKHPETPPKLEAHVSELVQELRSASTRLAAPVIFCICPPPPELAAAPERAALAARITADISASLEDVPGVHLLH